MIWPVDASVSQEYGSNPTRDLPADSWLIRTFGNYQPNGHTGIDFPVHEGTPVRAVANGTVKHVGWYSGSYADNPYWIAPAFAGFVLVIDHGGFIGIYAHLSGSPVAVGETVREGQTVAYSGNTGGSTGPHLHFEVLPDGWDFNNGMFGRVNPAQYFSAAAIAPQSSNVTKEDTLSAAEVKEIRSAIASSERRIIDQINAVMIGGYTWHGVKHYGIGPVVEETQRRLSLDDADGVNK
jgi:murein DD-endopeptidase MepM/ murein hydrolase activator NlpD